MILVGCAHQPETVGASAVDAVLGGRRMTVPFDELVARVPLADNEDFKVVEIGRDASSSHHIVALRGREPIHRHDAHDLLVVTLEGYGSMLLGDEESTPCATSRARCCTATRCSPRPSTARTAFRSRPRSNV